MKISDEAVEALAHALAHEASVEADMAGAGWDAENDSPEPFMPRARERARAYLEAAAPYLRSTTWLEGYEAGFRAGDTSDAAGAKADALEEAADLVEPFSGIGMASGATRGEVAQWLRERAAQIRRSQA